LGGVGGGGGWGVGVAAHLVGLLVALLVAAPKEVGVLRVKAAEGAEMAGVAKEVRARAMVEAWEWGKEVGSRAQATAAANEVGVVRMAAEQSCINRPCDDCPCRWVSQ